MDSETLRELNESIRELNDALSKQSSELLNYSSIILKSSNATVDNNNATNNSTKANNNAAQGTTKYGQTVSEVDEALKKQNADFARALGNTKSATLDFGRALVSADTSLTKYGNSAQQLGNAAWDVGKHFGILGKVVGGLLAGIGLVATSVLKLDQNIIDFRDGFTKQAGVLPVTTEKLGSLAKEAGFAYDRMPMLAKTVNNLGSSLLSLGGYAGEGAVRFMNIANVGEETRKKFSRLGLKQEDLLEYQSYYIELQKAGGQSLANKRKTDEQIQRESLAYAENLMVLSGLTGEKASTIKDRQQQEMLKMEEQSAILAENQEIERLRALGTDEATAKADEIAANQKLRKETIEYLAGIGREAEAYATGSVMRLGSYNDATAKFANVGLLQQANALKQHKDYVRFAEELTNDQMAQNVKMNTATQFVSDAAEQMGGLGQKSLVTVNQIGNDLSAQTKRLKEEQEGKGKEGADPLADAAAGIQELEILASQKFQSFLESIDPLRHGIEMFKDAAILAAGAIGGGMLIAGVAKVIGGKFGELGSARNPMYAKIVPGPTGGPGSFLKKMFGKSDTAAKETAPARKGLGGFLSKMLGRTAPAATEGVAGAAAAAGPLAKAGTGASALSGAAGAPGGSMVGMFLMGLSRGLSALGKAAPEVLLGAGALSGSIAIIGAGIATATWIVGKSLPSLASGLKAFDKVDGDKISKIGTGMAGLGAGLLAIGGSNITTAMGNIAKWVTGDDSDPIDNLEVQLQKFQKIDVDPDKIEKNSKAFVYFNKIIASAVEINGTMTGALARAFGSFFEVDIPLEKFKKFSDLEINPEQTEKNATAFKLFAEAMNSYKGAGTLSSLNIITRSIAGSVFSFYQALPTDEPIKRFKDFSDIKINSEQVKTNAIAFKDFANAMAQYKGGPGVLDAISQLAGGAIMSLFGEKGPVEAFKEFAREDFGPNMEKNAEAFSKYANAKAGGTSAPSGGGGGGGGAGGDSGGAGGDGGGGGGAGGDGGGTATPPADAAQSTTPTGPTPTITSSKEEVLSHVKTMTAADRAAFYKSLASQGIQKAAEARKAGNAEQASHWEKAAAGYTLAASIAESSSQDTAAGGTWKTSGKGYVYPVPDGADTSGYGYRTHPVKGGNRFHTGLDIGKGKGSPIIAANDGRIIRTSYDTPPYKGFGQIAIQDHGDGLQSVYAHLDKYSVREGDFVNKGKQIGTMGSTGMSTGPHLHYILQKAGGFDVPNKANTIDPKSRLTEKATGKAAKGGIFSGFESAITEGMAEAQKVGTLDPTSLVAKLGKTTVEQANAITKEVNSVLDMDLDSADLTPELLTMIETKLEKVLYALENNQSTHEKILKNSM